MENVAKYYKNKELVDDKSLDWSVFDMPIVTGDFIEQLEWTLMYLNFKNSMYGLRENEKQYHFKEFDGAWLSGQGRLGVDEEKDDMMFLNPGYLQATPDMFDSIHVKTFYLRTNEDNFNGIESWKYIPQKDHRHLPHFRNIVRERSASLHKNEKWYLHESYYRLEDSSRKIKFTESDETNEQLRDLLKELGLFIPINISFDPNYVIYEKSIWSHYLLTGDKRDIESYVDLVKRLNFMFNLRLSSYYEWFIYIRENDDSIGFKVPIRPGASKEIFALRDTNPGGNRKKAICNFVKEHLRTIGKNELTNEEVQTTIKKHIRGETKFNWRGLQVNVIPSEYDINRLNSKTKKYLTV